MASVARLIARLIQAHKRRQMWRRLTRALGISGRAGGAGTSVSLASLSTHLDVEWYARDIHPWDRDLPIERKAVLFAKGSLAHTVTAIRRAFERFPEVESVQIRVLDPRKPHGLLFAGSVFRGDLASVPQNLSPAMTLKLLGIAYRLIDGVLEPLQ